jgi:hypothetical protein
MTVRSGFIKALLLSLLAVMTALPVRSQEIRGTEFNEDSLRTARMDSIYRSLNDTASWQRELDYVRNLSFEEMRDSDLVKDVYQEEYLDDGYGRLTWKEKEMRTIDEINLNASEWEPEPRIAVWCSLLFPGGGQIYNRKYWKLPIVYGGFMGCIYAMNWNNTMYKDYAQAYLDLMDNDPHTQSYNQFLHLGATIKTDADKKRYEDIFRKRRDKYRRWRDLSFFVMLGVYALSVIDAYVDAELSVFDISKDLSLKVEPTIINNKSSRNILDNSSVGLQCSLNF